MDPTIYRDFTVSLRSLYRIFRDGKKLISPTEIRRAQSIEPVIPIVYIIVCVSLSLQNVTPY